MRFFLSYHKQVDDYEISSVVVCFSSYGIDKLNQDLRYKSFFQQWKFDTVVFMVNSMMHFQALQDDWISISLNKKITKFENMLFWQAYMWSFYCASVWKKH